MSEHKIAESLRVLLSEIIDYAGLFPPSQLSMVEAVRNYAEYSEGEYSWMLARFICPVARLEEFGDYASEFLNGKKIWRLSALAGENLQEDLRKIAGFNSANEGRAVIDALEIKVAAPEEVAAAKRLLPAGISAYVEFPLTIYINEFISAIAINRVRAKIRTGGITKDAFPPVDEVVKFMRICIAANLPFKATAGLHHPLRCVKPLTYEENAPTGTMHGFLNTFLTAAFLRQNLNASFAHRIMFDHESENFQFDDEGAVWNGNRVETAQIKLMRERNAISFGSCSFLEPVEDLQQLGLL